MPTVAPTTTGKFHVMQIAEQGITNDFTAIYEFILRPHCIYCNYLRICALFSRAEKETIASFKISKILEISVQIKSNEDEGQN